VGRIAATFPKEWVSSGGPLGRLPADGTGAGHPGGTSGAAATPTSGRGREEEGKGWRAAGEEAAGADANTRAQGELAETAEGEQEDRAVGEGNKSEEAAFSEYRRHRQEEGSQFQAISKYSCSYDGTQSSSLEEGSRRRSFGMPHFVL